MVTFVRAAQHCSALVKHYALDSRFHCLLVRRYAPFVAQTASGTYVVLTSHALVTRYVLAALVTRCVLAALVTRCVLATQVIRYVPVAQVIHYVPVARVIRYVLVELVTRYVHYMHAAVARLTRAHHAQPPATVCADMQMISPAWGCGLPNHHCHIVTWAPFPAAKHPPGDA